MSRGQVARCDFHKQRSGSYNTTKVVSRIGMLEADSSTDKRVGRVAGLGALFVLPDEAGDLAFEISG